MASDADRTPGRRYPQFDPNCAHPQEYRRKGDHPDVTGRWVSSDIDPGTVYCLRCEQPVSGRSEIHDYPLAERIVDAAIGAWLDRGFGILECQIDNESQRKLLESARYVHLANYSYALTPKILDELRRAGLLARGYGVEDGETK